MLCIEQNDEWLVGRGYLSAESISLCLADPEKSIYEGDQGGDRQSSKRPEQPTTLTDDHTRLLHHVPGLDSAIVPSLWRTPPTHVHCFVEYGHFGGRVGDRRSTPQRNSGSRRLTTASGSGAPCRTHTCGTPRRARGRARLPRGGCAAPRPAAARRRMPPTTTSSRSTDRNRHDQQQPAVGRVADPPIPTRRDDGLLGVDFDRGPKRASEGHDRPDPQRESQPHHDHSDGPREHRQPHRGNLRACREGEGDRRAERQRDPHARGAIAVATTLALNALAHPDSDFEQHPRREGEIHQTRHRSAWSMSTADAFGRGDCPHPSKSAPSSRSSAFPTASKRQRPGLWSACVCGRIRPGPRRPFSTPFRASSAVAQSSNDSDDPRS